MKTNIVHADQNNSRRKFTYRTDTKGKIDRFLNS